MELRYCEHCGDIIRTDDASSADSLEFGFICDACRARMSTEANGTDAAPEEKAEGSPAEAEEDAGGSPFSLENLNLFSSDTVVARRAQLQSQVETETSIRLHDPEDPAAAEDGVDGGEGAWSEDTQTEVIFSPEGQTPTATPGEASADLREGATRPGAAAGSVTPAPTARKIQFRCLHCPAILAIRPVESVSKLTCPRCNNPLYVGPQGKVTRTLQELVGKPAPSVEGPAAPSAAGEPDLPPGLADFLRRTERDRGPVIGSVGGALRALLLAAMLWLPVFAGIYLLNWGIPFKTPVSLGEIGMTVHRGLAKTLDRP